MIKAIVFDCFGVLYVDSHKSLIDAYPKKKAQLHDLGLATDYGLFSRNKYVEQVSEITGMKIDEVEKFIATEHTLNTSLVEYIRTELKDSYKIGLLSNVGKGWMDAFIGKHNLDNLFDDVVLSSDVGMVKPNAGIFELAADRLGAATSECIMIDDNVANVDGAQSAGMKAILYTDVATMKIDIERLHR